MSSVYDCCGAPCPDTMPESHKTYELESYYRCLVCETFSCAHVLPSIDLQWRDAAILANFDRSPMNHIEVVVERQACP